MDTSLLLGIRKKINNPFEPRLVPPFSTEEDAYFEEEERQQAQQQREYLDQFDENPDESLDFFLPPKKIYYR